ncbi:MAG: NAD-dependent epimerase/dehydratase family protein [Planctomycetota bacterium]
MKHFVTGATGLLGGRLCRALAESGDEVVAFCRNPDRLQVTHDRISTARGDVTDAMSLEKGIEGCDTCFHLAALARQWHPDPDAFTKVNFQGTINVMEAAASADVKRFVYTSTAGVYGASTEGAMVDESVGLERAMPTAYELSKRSSQQLFQIECMGGFPGVVVNPARVFGPGPLNESNSVAKIMAQYKSGDWRFKPGNGESIGNYVFVDDVVQGHIAAMRQGRVGEAYILGGENLSFNQLFDLIGDVVGQRRKLRSVPLWLLKFYSHLQMLKARLCKLPPSLTPPFVDKYSRNYCLSSDKAVKELGYSITPIREAIEQTLAGLSN